jgi:hypothetical protein
MHSMLSSFGLAILTLLGLAGVLGLVLVVMVEIRCLVRINRELGAPEDESRSPADVDQSRHARRLWRPPR